jgi:hypothetical protein
MSLADPPDEHDSSAQLPAVIPPGAVTAAADLDPAALVPALIAAAGDTAGWRYVEFICNPHTQRAYARACSQFFA